MQEVKIGLMGNRKSSGSYSASANVSLTASGVVWELKTLASPRNLTKMQNLGPTLDLLSNNLHIFKTLR